VGKAVQRAAEKVRPFEGGEVAAHAAAGEGHAALDSPAAGTVPCPWRAAGRGRGGGAMQFGFLFGPWHPPERSLYACQEWNLQMLRWADELGFSEAWIAEHHTSPWENHSAPDLLVAQALRETKSIRLGPGGFLLPYHHPAELANRLAWLDHLSRGRLNFGVAASALPSDWALFNVDGEHGQNREMTREALDIILKLWSEDEPFDYHGKFWSVSKTGPMHEVLRPFLKPYQQPHPPIGVAGLSPGSETLKIAGERGFIPMSLNLNIGYVASHWDSVLEGARRSGRTPRRSEWRLVREVFVAETDEEAYRLAVGGFMGRFFESYFLKLFRTFDFLKYYKHDAEVPDRDVTVDYCARYNWLVGSPTTVAEKLRQSYEEVGGFGTLLISAFDYHDQPEAWYQCMRLLAEEVLPRVRDLTPAD